MLTPPCLSLNLYLLPGRISQQAVKPRIITPEHFREQSGEVGGTQPAQGIFHFLSAAVRFDRVFVKALYVYHTSAAS